MYFQRNKIIFYDHLSLKTFKKKKKTSKEKHKRVKFRDNILILDAISNSHPFSRNFSYLLDMWHSLHHMLDQILFNIKKKYSSNTNIFK